MQLCGVADLLISGRITYWTPLSVILILSYPCLRVARKMKGSIENPKLIGRRHELCRKWLHVK